MVIPKGYKQTEVGVIPEDWGITTLENQYSITSSKRVFQSEWRDSGVPFYRAREIAVMGEGFPAPDSLFITTDMYEQYTKKYGAIKENDVLITGVGTLGKVYVVKKNDRFYFKDGNIIWLQWNGQYSSQFLKHLYRTPVLIDQVFGNAGGSTVPTYTISNAKTTIVPYPDYAEQCRIAEVINAMDSFITTTEKLLAKKKAIKQGAMQELLTGKRRLPGFTGKWEYTQIGSITDVFSGGTPNTAIPQYWGGSIPWMSSGELNNKHVYDVKGRITDIGLEASSTHYIPENCVLIGLAGQGRTRGTAAINHFPLCTNQSIAAIYPNPDKFDSLFLFYLMDTQYKQLRELSSGDGGRGGLTKQLIKDYFVFMPTCLEEQHGIAMILFDMDNEITKLEQKLAKYREIKQGMMQQLLTGKIRLV